MNKVFGVRAAGSRRGSAKRLTVPRAEKSWLLAGTALATTIFALGAAPASACGITSGGGLGFDQITCSGETNGFTDGRFVAEDNIHATTKDQAGDPTYLYNDGNGGGDKDVGFYIDGRNDINAGNGGFSILVDTFDQTAIRAVGTGIAVEVNGGTNGDGKADITINNGGFIQAGGNGIYAGGYSNGPGNITITNTGIIGVDFDDNLHIVAGSFTTDGGTTPATLTAGSAFVIGEVGGAGIYATNGSATSTIDITNAGSIYAAEQGIYAASQGGAITLRNISTSTIISGGNGLEAVGAGGAVTIFNGDNSQNTPPTPDNPDGRIIADLDGIHATNTNGGAVSAFNGLKYDSNSEIFASGNYGIYVDSTGDGDGEGTVQAWNMGYIETEGDGALAGIHASTDGVGTGFAGAYNGIVLGSDIPGRLTLEEDDLPPIISPNARVNAYDIDVADGGLTVTTDIGSADGIEIVVDGGFHDPDGAGPAGRTIASPELFDYIGDLVGVDLSEVADFEASDLSLNFTAFAYNYGTWDFEGADHYLTPGFANGEILAPRAVGAVTTGGVFAPGGSAFTAQNFGNGSTGLFNYGTMIGSIDTAPVLAIEATHNAQGSGGLGDAEEIVDIPNFVFIYNAGYNEYLVPSDGEVEPYLLPEEYETFATYGVIGNVDTPSAWNFSAEEAFTTKFGMMADGGVDWDFVDNMLADAAVDNDRSELSRFRRAAEGLLLDTDGDGPGVIAFNQGLLIGRMDVAADNDSLALLINDGTWFTGGTSNFYGSEADILLNTGLVQTAFDGSDVEETVLNSLNYSLNFGVISLMDGAFQTKTIDDVITTTAGDRLIINGNYVGGPGIEGDFLTLTNSALSEAPLIGTLLDPSEGSEPAEQQGKLFAKGHIALDTFLASQNSNLANADFVDINGFVAGSTGLILLNDERSEDFRGINNRGVDVVEYDQLLADDCGGNNGVCVEGDAFYISSLSPDYFAVDGVGALADGLFATYLVHDEQYKDFELRTTWGPGATNAPALITGAQHIFYDTLAVVDDHSYGQQFAGAGGSGADLPVDAPVYDTPSSVAAGSQYGLWVKGSGSWTDFDGTTSDNGLVETSTEGSQDTYSVLGGADMKWDPNSPFRFGVFGGYVTSSLDFDNSGSADYEGGTLGAYLAYNNGAFYVDGTVKGDWLNTDYDFVNLDVGADVTNVGVAANTGYRFTMGAAYFEPNASFTYVHTSVDGIDDGAASVDFSNGDSIRAGVGARIGTAFSTGAGTTTDLSLLGKVWNEFEDANTVTVDDGNGNTATFSDDISGLFGEVNAVATVTSANNLSGFVSAGGQFGENFTSFNAKVGVRKGF